jgi:integrase/recombinase XerC/integrase/recombinase XerD
MKQLSRRQNQHKKAFDLSHQHDLIESFLNSLDVLLNSQETYRRGLHRFLSWLREFGVINPEREDILAYKAYLTKAALSALTISTYLVIVRRFFEYLESRKLYPNVAKSVKGAKTVRVFKKDALSISQIKDLLCSIDRSTLVGKRDFAIVNLLIRTGLRTIEVVRANVGDMRNFGTEAILDVQGKGRASKEEIVLLCEETLRPLQEYLAARGEVKGNEPLFAGVGNRNRGRLTTRSIRGLVKWYLRRIGLNHSRVTAHSLRHTAVTLSLLGGATLQEAQALARHSQITTTMVYAQNLKRIQEAAERKIAALLVGVN